MSDTNEYELAGDVLSTGSLQECPVVAIDAHVHIYSMANLKDALEAGRQNLESALVAGGYQPDACCLMLTETAQDDAFGALSAKLLHAEGWTIQQLPQDAAALHAIRRRDAAELFLIAGRQIVTKERIEILTYATCETFPDGQPIRDVLEDLRTRAIPAVLPWGLGKWMGARGRNVSALLGEASSGELMLGDNGGRPVGWSTPPLFGKAATKDIPILPGSDPLPVRGAEAGIGSFGFALKGALDRQRPAEDLRARLIGLRGQPAVIGQRQQLPVVFAQQIALRRAKANLRRRIVS